MAKLTAAQVAAEAAEQPMTLAPWAEAEERIARSGARFGGAGVMPIPTYAGAGGAGGAAPSGTTAVITETGGTVTPAGESQELGAVEPGPPALPEPLPLAPEAPQPMTMAPPVTQTLTQTLRQQGRRVAPRGPDMGDVPREFLPQIGGRFMDPSIYEDEDAFTNELNTAVLKGDMTEEQRNAAIQKREQYKQTYWGELGKGASIAQRGATLAGETQAAEAGIQASAADATAAELQEVEEDIKAGREAGEQRLVDYKEGRKELEGKRDAADKAILEHKIGDTRGVGERVFDGLVAALGEASRALTGGARNNALDIIRANVDRSVKAQETQLASYRGQAEKVRNNLSVYRQEFGDEEVARLALRDQQLEEHQRGLEQIMAETDSESLKNRAQSIVQQIELDRESIANQFTVGAHESKMAADAARQQAAAAAAARKPREWRSGFGGKGQPNLNQLYVDLGGGVGGVAPSKESAAELRTANEVRGRLNGLIAEQKHLVSQVGSSMDAKLLGTIESNQSEIRTTLGVAKQLGALSKDDVGIVDDFVGGDPTEIVKRKDRTIAGLDNAVNVIGESWRQKLAASGMPVAERRIGVEGPEYRYTGSIAGGAKQVEEGAPVP
jgi:hypothetical protein